MENTTKQINNSGPSGHNRGYLDGRESALKGEDFHMAKDGWDEGYGQRFIDGYNIGWEHGWDSAYNER